MYPAEPLRICEKCDIRHYENCPDCFGFGVYTGQSGIMAPVSAGAAHDQEKLDPSARACPTCRSTVAGVPAPVLTSPISGDPYDVTIGPNAVNRMPTDAEARGDGQPDTRRVPRMPK